MARVLRPHRNAPVPDALQAISGLQAYYRTDLGVSIVSGAASQMLDQSGKARTASQAGATRPTYASGGINGLPVVTGAGTQYLSTVSKAGLDGLAGVHVFAVAQVADTTGSYSPFGLRDGNTGGWFFRISAGTVVFFCYTGANVATGGAGTAIAANTWKLLEGWYDGANVSTSVNAAAATSAAMTGNIGTATATGLGILAAAFNGFRIMAGKVALAVAYDHALSGSDQTAARAYINGLYAIY